MISLTYLKRRVSTRRLQSTGRKCRKTGGEIAVYDLSLKNKVSSSKTFLVNLKSRHFDPVCKFQNCIKQT